MNYSDDYCFSFCELTLYATIAWFKQIHCYRFNRYFKENPVPQLSQFVYKNAVFS